MKICIAQTKPVKGNISKNIENHKILIEKAVSKGVDIIVFPELSITGYEPELAKELASTQADKRLDIFQDISNVNKIVIGVGLPTRESNNTFISMIIFQPQKDRLTYSKQHLHPTEVDYFIPGQNQIYLKLSNSIIAPAICYELSKPEHSENAYKNNANIYIASVLNSVSGVDNDIKRLSAIASKYKMIVLMANYIGQSGGYQCAGKSSIWNNQGLLVGQLNDKNEGLLIFDTEQEQVIEVIV